MKNSISHQRIDKFLQQKLSLKKTAIRLALARGDVVVDGKVISNANTIVHKFSRIDYQQQNLQANNAISILLHKPSGVVSAVKDTEHPTVIDTLRAHNKNAQIIDDSLIDELHIAGRLDRFTTGLLLLTNDSRFSERISLPTSKVAKYYRVTLANELTEEYIAAFADGMYFGYEDITTKPAELAIISSHVAQVKLVEGRYHQIKRMFGRFRNPVVALHRYSIGNLTLESELLPGQFRCLTDSEVSGLLSYNK